MRQGYIFRVSPLPQLNPLIGQSYHPAKCDYVYSTTKRSMKSFFMVFFCSLCRAWPWHICNNCISGLFCLCRFHQPYKPRICHKSSLVVKRYSTTAFFAAGTFCFFQSLLHFIKQLLCDNRRIALLFTISLYWYSADIFTIFQHFM